MPLSRTEAERALEDVARTESRASAFINGRHIAPHLFLWGVIWMIGYGSSAYRADLNNVVWPVLTLVGTVGSFAIGILRSRAARDKGGWTYMAGFGLIAAFTVASLYVLRPADPDASSAFIPLVVGLVYALMGLGPGLRRLLFLGVAVTTLTLVGFVQFGAWFDAWMAAVGGGALILGGIWMRRI